MNVCEEIRTRVLARVLTVSLMGPERKMKKLEELTTINSPQQGSFLLFVFVFVFTLQWYEHDTDLTDPDP